MADSVRDVKIRLSIEEDGSVSGTLDRVGDSVRKLGENVGGASEQVQAGAEGMASGLDDAGAAAGGSGGVARGGRSAGGGLSGALQRLMSTMTHYRREQMMQQRQARFFAHELTSLIPATEGVRGGLTSVISLFVEGAAGGLSFGLALEAVKLGIGFLTESMNEAKKKAKEWLEEMKKVADISARIDVQNRAQGLRRRGVPEQLIESLVGGDRQVLDEAAVKAGERLREARKKVDAGLSYLPPVGKRDVWLEQFRETGKVADEAVKYYSHVRDAAKEYTAAEKDLADVEATIQQLMGSAKTKYVDDQTEAMKGLTESTRQYRDQAAAMQLVEEGLDTGTAALNQQLRQLSVQLGQTLRTQQEVLSPENYERWRDAYVSAYEDVREATISLAQAQAQVQAARVTRSVMDQAQVQEQVASDLARSTTDLEKKLRAINLEMNDQIVVIMASVASDEQKAEHVHALRVAYDRLAEAIRLVSGVEAARSDSAARLRLDEYVRGLEEEAAGINQLDLNRRAQVEQFDQMATEANLSMAEYNARYDEFVGLTARLKSIADGTATSFKQMASQVADAMSGTLSEGIYDILEGTEDLSDVFARMGDSFASSIRRMVASIISSQIMQLLRMMASYVMTAFGAPAVAAPTGGGSGALTLSGGGLVWGPGSSTSDDVPVMASRGEFMVQAAAVRHYGPALLHALNERRLGLRGSSFAEGGMVGAAQSQAGPTQVNVVNNTGQEATVSRRKDVDGREVIDVVVGQVAQSIAGGGVVDKAIQGRYGVQPKGVRRG